MQTNTYAFDLSLTNDCNFQCVYCIERGYFRPEYLSIENAKLIANQLKKLYDSEYFKSIGIDTLSISFWGGEPTLNIDAMKCIVEELKEYKVIYGIFTNGYLLTTELLDYIKKINEKQQFHIQISYDGGPLQDNCRKCSLIESTYDIIANKIRTVSKTKIPFHLKSTASFKYFKYLYDSYLDICNLADELEIDLKHSVTLDYSPQTLNKLNLDQIEDYKKDLEHNLLQIAKNEKKRILENKNSVFSWFDVEDKQNRALCAAGHKFYTIDTDGSIYTCHGCLYSEKQKEHIICNIINDSISDVVHKLQHRDNLFNNICDETEYCKDCTTHICFRCNCIAYESSNKKDYIERWKDFSNQKILCDIYKMTSNIYLSLLLSINQETYQKYNK